MKPYPRDRLQICLGDRQRSLAGLFLCKVLALAYFERGYTDQLKRNYRKLGHETSRISTAEIRSSNARYLAQTVSVTDPPLRSSSFSPVLRAR